MTPLTPLSSALAICQCRGNIETLLVLGFARLVTEEYDRGNLSQGQLFCTGAGNLPGQDWPGHLDRGVSKKDELSYMKVWCWKVTIPFR